MIFTRLTPVFWPGKYAATLRIDIYQMAVHAANRMKNLKDGSETMPPTLEAICHRDLLCGTQLPFRA